MIAKLHERVEYRREGAIEARNMSALPTIIQLASFPAHISHKQEKCTVSIMVSAMDISEAIISITVSGCLKS